jgi:PAS domain S-box-containing protein
MKTDRTAGQLRTILAVQPVLVAFILQWMFWPYIQPYAWFLFYPAVFLSSWIGGLSGGLAATAISTTLVFYFFISPQLSFAAKSPKDFLSVGVFIAMGVLFSLFHDRLRKNTRQATEALVALRSTNEQLESRVLERTADLARTNESLRTSEARLQTIVENLGEGVAVSSLDGQLLHFNRAALDMHGFADFDECRRHLTEFAHIFELSVADGTILPLDQWPLARILRGENTRGLEVRVRRIQSDWQRVFSYGGTLVRDASGQPVIAVVTISDITERKRSEEGVRRYADELRAANEELMRFNRSMVDRELRMIELKKEINELSARLGHQPRYSLDFETDYP